MGYFTSFIDRLRPHTQSILIIIGPLFMTVVFTTTFLAFTHVAAGIDRESTPEKATASQNLQSAIRTFVNNNALKVTFTNNEPRFLLGVSGTELAGVKTQSGTLRFSDQEAVFGSRFANNDDTEKIFGSSALKKIGVLGETGTELDWLAVMNKKTFDTLPNHAEVRTASTPGGLKLFLVITTSTLDTFPSAIKEPLKRVGEETSLNGTPHQNIALGSQLVKRLQAAKLPSKPLDRLENFLGKKAIIIETLPETHTLLDEAYFVGSAFRLNTGK